MNVNVNDYDSSQIDKYLLTGLNILVRFHEDKHTVKYGAYRMDGSKIEMPTTDAEKYGFSQICTCADPAKCHKSFDNLFTIHYIKPEHIAELKNTEKISFMSMGAPHCPLYHNHYYKVSIMRANDLDDNQIGYYQMIDDITEEELLRQEDEALHRDLASVLSSSNMSLWRADVATHKMRYYVNDHLSIEDADERMNLIHPDERETLYKTIFDTIDKTSILKSGVIRKYNPLKKKYDFVEVNAVPQFDKNNKVVGYLGITQDVSGKVKTLKQLSDYQRNSEMVQKVARTVQLRYSKTHDKLTGLKIKELGRDSITLAEYISWIHEEDRQKIQDEFAQLKENPDYEARVVVRIKYPGEDEYSRHRIIAVRVTNPRTNRFYYLGISQDVSKEFAMMDALEDLRKEADENNHLKSAFLANISHDLRSPLNAIIGFSTLMEEEETSTEERKQYSHMIKTNGNMLLHLIDDILEISKIEAGELKRRPQVFDVRALFEHTFKSLDVQYDRAFINFELDIPEGALMVNSDQNRMVEMYHNFVSNAFKYTDKGFIRMGYKVNDEGIYMYVQDTGCGISPEDQKKVFNRFEKLGSNKKGTGLGMAIIKSYVDEVGGKIGVDSEVGVGSTFWVQLPNTLFDLGENNSCM